MSIISFPSLAYIYKTIRLDFHEGRPNLARLPLLIFTRSLLLNLGVRQQYHRLWLYPSFIFIFLAGKLVKIALLTCTLGIMFHINLFFEGFRLS